MKLDFSFSLPAWIESFVDLDKPFNNIQDRMDLVIELSKKNVEYKTGGPFGAAIFNLKTNKIVALGVNLVTTAGSSVLHAEMVAIMIAQKTLNVYDLSANNMEMELVASTEPCAMCFGSVPWSGVRQLVCGAKDADARSIGFDEGPKMENWASTLEDRGIKVIQDIQREKAASVLDMYYKTSGEIYNGRK